MVHLQNQLHTDALLSTLSFAQQGIRVGSSSTETNQCEA